VALARELAQMAETYPRFRGAINRARHQVLIQVRDHEWKCKATLKFLSLEPATIQEISEETGLDHQSLNHALAALEIKGEAGKCTRDGGPIVIRRDNKPASTVYWRKTTSGHPPPSLNKNFR
jgi:DNA-binding transcriptional ArsR family regulator